MTLTMPVSLIQLAIVVVIVTAAIETVQWFLVFRRPEFQGLKKRLAMQQDKITISRNTAPVKGSKSTKDKKQDRLENQMANETAKIFSSINFWTKGVGAVFMFATYRLVARWLDEVPVAKLPFEPMGFFKNFTHRRLDGTDWSAASVTFMFTLCTMSLKANLTQWLQLGPDRAMAKVMTKGQKKMWESSQDRAKKIFGDPKSA